MEEEMVVETVMEEVEMEVTEEMGERMVETARTDQKMQIQLLERR